MEKALMNHHCLTTCIQLSSNLTAKLFDELSQSEPQLIEASYGTNMEPQKIY